MIAKDLINYMIPPLKLEDRREKALRWMEELKVAELPVVNKGEFVGLADEEILMEPAEIESLSGIPSFKGSDCFVYDNQHYYELLAKAQQLGYRMVGVLDAQNRYLGVVSVENVVEAFAQTTSVRHPGAILVLSVAFKDYSLGQIADLIERNGIIILSSYLAPQLDQPDRYRLTLKLDTEEISQIASVLENHGYLIEARFNEQEISFNEKERLEGLFRFLTP